MQRKSTHIEIWDPLLRSFHWLLVGTFALAWWSEGRDIQLHLLAGSALMGLLFFRLIWGVAGEYHARFTNFQPSIRSIRQHLGELIQLKAKAHTGHTPIGSLMIYVLMTALFIITVSGLLLAGMQMGVGPFAGWASGASFSTEILVQQVHHWCFEFLQILVAVHLAGVAVESVLQRSNLTAAMLTGKKTIKEEN